TGEHKSGDRIVGALLGQVQIQAVIYISNGQHAVQQVASIVFRYLCQRLFVKFIGNLADDLLKQILKRDNTFHSAIFVHHNGQMGPGGLHLPESGAELSSVRNELGRMKQPCQVELFSLRLFEIRLQVSAVDNANYAVQLVTVDRHAGISQRAERLLGFLKSCSHRQCLDRTARHHYLADFGIGKLEHPLQQSLLFRFDGAALPGSIDQMTQLVRRVGGDTFGRGMQPEQPNGAGSGPVQQPDRPVEELVEDTHRPGDCQGNPFSPLKGQRFGRQLSKYDMQKRNGGKRKGKGNSVPQCIGNQSPEGLFQQIRKGRLAYPAQGERGHGDAELRCGDIGIQVVYQFKKQLGTTVAILRKHLDTRTAHRHQCKLGGDEETVSQYEQQHYEDVRNGQEHVHIPDNSRVPVSPDPRIYVQKYKKGQRLYCF